ncbi:MAG: MltA domain-containing protein [Alphaproteobacteria bacterium]|nr:MltA domain-containing protein [Alphaproteobacteria bacterium]
MTNRPLAFCDLDGWEGDDHEAALAAFRQSFEQLRADYPLLPEPGNEPARSYFEINFQPQRATSGDSERGAFFTGYYEPILRGSRLRSERFRVPLLRRPDDLVTLVDDHLRASSGDALTHVRIMDDGSKVAFATREQIEGGCLDDQALALMYLDDAVDAFFLHIQGSGLIELDYGERVRVSYSAKNGHPYTSIGRELIADGVFCEADMNLPALVDWLKADPERAQRTMWRNASYIFFEERGPADEVSAVGARNIPLTAGRSLAVDASLHALGLPMFVSVDRLAGDGGAADFRRLMIAQDVGSAIRGPARGDIFYGTGEEAGRRAGVTRHFGNLYVLLPRAHGAG